MESGKALYLVEWAGEVFPGLRMAIAETGRWQSLERARRADGSIEAA
jgi:hypothetical protein